MMHFGSIATILPGVVCVCRDVRGLYSAWWTSEEGSEGRIALSIFMDYLRCAYCLLTA